MIHKLIGRKVKVKKNVKYRNTRTGTVVCEVHSEGKPYFIVQFKNDWCYYTKDELAAQ